MPQSLPGEVKALLFDVFGTVVDWRASVITALRAFGAAHGLERDWSQFADDWRALYQPSMEAVRTGARPWAVLDQLHRESLVTLLRRYEITGLDDTAIDGLNRAWHRLDPWPDVLPGLSRLRPAFILAPQSNGNIALIVNMARRAGLGWDVVLGAEVARAYKPQPEAYLRAAAALDLAPGQCMMVAAHNNDLEAAAPLGFRTAFVIRPAEHGPGQTTDLKPSAQWDVVTDSFNGLADALGC